MNIKQILKGVKPGRLQSVGYLQIIPLVSQLIDERFVSPAQTDISTAGYGKLVFSNKTSDKTTIIPTHTAYVTKQAAQDHAMMHLGLLKSHSEKQYNTAACIQETQGGYMSQNKYEFFILPWSLREISLKKRYVETYSKIWDDIKIFNQQLGLNSKGHLEFFVKEFKSELDLFIAQFEIIPNQIGAIILINGSVVGIERVPNYQYWRELWKPLIRECYGSLSLQTARGIWGSVKDRIPATRIPMKSNVMSLDDIENELNRVTIAETETVKTIINNIISDDFEITNEPETSNGFKAFTLENKMFIGQIIADTVNIVSTDDKIVYASLITKQKWFKNQEWFEAGEFSM